MKNSNIHTRSFINEWIYTDISIDILRILLNIWKKIYEVLISEKINENI